MSGKYPEHTKLKAIASKSQVCGEFVEWLADKKGIVLAQFHGLSGHHYQNPTPLRALLAEFFEIDSKKIEEEKRAMLDEMRAMNGA